MVIPTITFANSSSVSDYVDPLLQDYLRNEKWRVPLKMPEALNLVYLICTYAFSRMSSFVYSYQRRVVLEAALPLELW